MPPWRRISASLLALLLAGCASRHGRRPTAHSLDWESEDGVAKTVASTNLAVQPLPQSWVTPAPRAATTTTNQSHETWVALNRWCRTQLLPPPARITASLTPTFALQTTNGDFVLSAGSTVASWDGLQVRLGFSPELIDGQVFLHVLDLRKTLEPLITDTPLPLAKTNRVIVIDPGHGGENAGTRSYGGKRYEKEFTLDWALRLAPLLETNGWQVFLTRTNDSDLALSNRVNFAESHKADLFLSLHFNSAAPDEIQRGLESYCLTPAGMPSTLTRGFEDDASATFPNNAFDAQNLALAARVHRALVQAGASHDRGVRRARFPGVLRGQQRPAILIEGGYLSSPGEAALIGRAAHRQKLAEAIAGALSTRSSRTNGPVQKAEAAGGGGG